MTPPADSASAASTLSATHPFLHPKPRIGMTSTTKLHYEPTDQRFTLDDMQPQAVSNTLSTLQSTAHTATAGPSATETPLLLSVHLTLDPFFWCILDQRAAREEVHAMFTASSLVTHPPWNASTLPSHTPLEQSTHFDDKHYAALQTAHLVHRAHTRLALIRAHQDPDADTRHIQPRWNVSSKLDDDEGHKRDMDVLKGLGGKRDVQLAEYVGPVEAEVRWDEQNRLERRQREEEARVSEQRRREAADWERKEQWQADTTPIATLPTHSYMTSSATSALPPLSPSRASAALSQYLQSTPPLQLTTAVSPVVSGVRVEPVSVYCHPGHYAWVSPALRQWSCCHSAVHSIRGCVRVADAKDKVRLVTAGSEDGRGRVVRLVHGGVWEAGRDGGMWSCCGCGERNGKGCQAKTLVREDRWNIE